MFNRAVQSRLISAVKLAVFAGVATTASAQFSDDCDRSDGGLGGSWLGSNLGSVGIRGQRPGATTSEGFAQEVVPGATTHEGSAEWVVLSQAESQPRGIGVNRASPPLARPPAQRLRRSWRQPSRVVYTRRTSGGPI